MLGSLSYLSRQSIFEWGILIASSRKPPMFSEGQPAKLALLYLGVITFYPSPASTLGSLDIHCIGCIAKGYLSHISGRPSASGDYKVFQGLALAHFPETFPSSPVSSSVSTPPVLA